MTGTLVVIWIVVQVVQWWLLSERLNAMSEWLGAQSKQLAKHARRIDTHWTTAQACLVIAMSKYPEQRDVLVKLLEEIREAFEAEKAKVAAQKVNT